MVCYLHVVTLHGVLQYIVVTLGVLLYIPYMVCLQLQEHSDDEAEVKSKKRDREDKPR